MKYLLAILLLASPAFASQMTASAGTSSTPYCSGGNVLHPCNVKTDLAQPGDPWLVAISSIIGDGTTVTVTTSVAHGLSTGASVEISGVYTYSGTAPNSMSGTVTSYSGTTLVVNATASVGSGTFTSWTFDPVPATIVAPGMDDYIFAIK